MVSKNEPILYRMRKGTSNDPFVEYSQIDKVRNNKILLKEIPNDFQGLRIKSEDGIDFFYKKDGFPDSNTTIIDWEHGELYFADEHNGKKFTITFYGTGNVYISSASVYVDVDNNTGEITETLKGLTDDMMFNRDLAAETNEQVQLAEDIRVQSEDNRLTNESNRVSNETARSSGESTRNSNENSRKNAESTRVANEQTRESNETTRITSENQRLSDEELRISAESIRKSNEDVRVAKETERQSAESTRIQNEQTRQTQETSRQNQEAVRQEKISNTKFIEPYNTTTTYKENNIVSFNGASFICIQETVGNPPPDPLVENKNAYWGVLSRKGHDGTGTVHVHKDEFVATEGQRVFNLSHTYDQFQNRTTVIVGGVVQKTPQNYEETTSTSITLSEGVSKDTIVEVKYFSESVPLQSDIQTTVDNHTGTLSTHATKLNNHEATLSEHTSQLVQTSEEVNRLESTKAERGELISLNTQWGNKTNHPSFFEQAGLERQNTIPIPKIVNDVNNPILENTTPAWADGSFFFTVLHAAELLTNPIDKFYAYAATHDADSIWLATAPTPEGPWTWQQPVIELGVNTRFVHHVSSPSVVVHNGQIYLYYHGKTTIVAVPQPSALAISSDGITFTEHATFPLINTHPNRSKFYGESVSYLRVIKDGSLFIGVFQANTMNRNEQSIGVPTSVGYVLSEDGINWHIGKKPLLSNLPGNRGPFGPNIIKLFNKWCLFYMDFSKQSIHMAVSDTLEPGTFEIIGEVIPKGTLGSWNAGRTADPEFLFFNNKLYIYYDGMNGNVGSIGVATVDWRNAQ